MTDQLGDVQALLQGAGEVAARAARTAEPDADLVRYVVAPAGWETKLIEGELEQFRHHPRRKTGALRVTTIEAFLDYTKRHKTDASIIEADQSGRFRTIFDHHEPSQSDQGEAIDPARAGWMDHTVTLVRQESRGWQAWKKFAGDYRTQHQLAEFLEERRLEIYDGADQATLIELSEFFEAARETHVASSRRLANGNMRLEYVEAVASTRGRQGEIEVPTLFTVAVKLFRDDDEPMQFEVRLRWRIQGGEPTFLFILAESVDEAIEERLTADAARINNDSGLTVYPLAGPIS